MGSRVGKEGNTVGKKYQSIFQNGTWWMVQTSLRPEPKYYCCAASCVTKARKELAMCPRSEKGPCSPLNPGTCLAGTPNPMACVLPVSGAASTGCLGSPNSY